jgi:hypothetical protein
MKEYIKNELKNNISEIHFIFQFSSNNLFLFSYFSNLFLVFGPLVPAGGHSHPDQPIRAMLEPAVRQEKSGERLRAGGHHGLRVNLVRTFFFAESSSKKSKQCIYGRNT